MRLLSLWAFGLLRQCRSVPVKTSNTEIFGRGGENQKWQTYSVLLVKMKLGAKILKYCIIYDRYFLLIIEIPSCEVKTFKQTCLHLLECFFQVFGSLGSSQLLCIPAVVLHSTKILCIYFSVCAHCLGIFYVYTIFGN